MEGNTEKEKNPGMKRALLWSGNLVPGQKFRLFETGVLRDEKTLSGHRKKSSSSGRAYSGAGAMGRSIGVAGIPSGLM